MKKSDVQWNRIYESFRYSKVFIVSLIWLTFNHKLSPEKTYNFE